MTTQEHIESMIPTPRAVVESINQQVNQLEKSMKTETQLEEMFGGGPKLPPTHWMERYAEASKRVATLAAENKRLREALEELAEDLSGRSANEFGLGNWITAEIFLDFATAARAALKGGAQ